MNIIQRTLLCSIGLLVLCGEVMSQVECSGWGEMRGIRVDGQLLPVITTLAIASPHWEQTAQTAHWRTRTPTYARDGGDIVITGKLGFGRAGAGVSYRQTISNVEPRMAKINVEVTADKDIDLDGVYMYVSVAAADFGEGTGELIGADETIKNGVRFATSRPTNDRQYVKATASGARLVGPYTVELTLTEPGQITIEDDRSTQSKQLSLLFPIHVGDMKKGQTVQTSFTIKVSGAIDHSAANVRIDPSQPGQPFAGIGGNFCWQLDSPTVEYYLDHLRVTWARVSFPMPLWQPHEHDDPTTQPTNQLAGELQTDLRMASELHRRNIPIIMTVWSAPDWALVHRLSNRPQAGGNRPSRIDPAKWDALATSIGSYLLRFKDVVGAEPDLFSFNESNLGINVLMSPTEHRDAIKRLGAKFAQLGLKTKMMLGDANEPHAVDYVKTALADPQAMRYVGAVSYHSWNGGTDEQLMGWHEHAMEAHLPLIVAEAGYDPDAHLYRTLIDEPWYALEEVKLNLRCITLSQPESILHWQFTPDYGLVTGGSSPSDPIRTTQRWWQYKQLSDLTPPNAAILPVTSDRPEIIVSALASKGQGVSAVHIANTGAEREAVISGLPDDLKEMRCWVTDHTRSMQPIDSGTVSDGTLEVTVPAQSFLTLAR